jgi:hypothetical protein
MFCKKCGGSGKFLGNGMITMNCRECSNKKHVDSSISKLEDNNSKFKIDKKSKAYVEAIRDIMTLNPEISRREAAKIFSETFDKL